MQGPRVSTLAPLSYSYLPIHGIHHSYTIESSPERVVAAKVIIAHAGLSKTIDVLEGVFNCSLSFAPIGPCSSLPKFHAPLPPPAPTGFAADIIPTLKKNFGVAIVDLVLLDHSAASYVLPPLPPCKIVTLLFRYVSDIAVASTENLLATGT